MNLAGIRRVLQLQEETRQLQADLDRLKQLAGEQAGGQRELDGRLLLLLGRLEIRLPALGLAQLSEQALTVRSARQILLHEERMKYATSASPAENPEGQR